MDTHERRRRAVAIACLRCEIDAPDLVSWEIAAANYDHVASTAAHSGDCTHESHTCLRCMREEVDAKADQVLQALDMLNNGDG